MLKVTGKDLVNSPTVRKAMTAIDTDAFAAIKLANKVLGSSTAKLYSNATFSAYDSDTARLEKSMGDFNAAWLKVVGGKVKTPKEIIKTYTRYVLALEVLEQSNTRHQAMMTAGYALIVEDLVETLLKWIKAMKKRLGKLEKELKEIEALVRKAHSNVTGAKAQLALNIAVTAISLCLGPVGWGARIGVAAGGMAAHTIIDAALGPSKGSAEGALTTATGESVELVDKLSSGSKKILGAAFAVRTMKLDADEIALAKKIVRIVQKRLRKAAGEYDNLLQASKKWNTEIVKLKKKYDAALRSYESAAKKFKSSKRKREQLLKEFKQWK
jgi:hypothetical protein